MSPYHNWEEKKNNDTSNKSRGSNNVNSIGHRENKTDWGCCCKGAPRNGFLSLILNVMLTFLHFYLSPESFHGQLPQK